MIRKPIILFFFGIIVGATLSSVSVYYFYESTASKFIEAQLSEQEHISVEAFNNYSSREIVLAQTHYLLFVHRAKQEGLITEHEYQRAASLANMRLCINYEDEGEIDKAKNVCKWTKDHLSQWKSNWDYEEFKNKHREYRDKKEIPDFSLVILTEELKGS